MFQFNKNKYSDARVFGENTFSFFVKTCARTFIWQPRQLSNCWLSSFVERPQRMWWEWPLAESEGEKERLRRDKDYKRGNERGTEGVRDKRQEREGEGGQSRLMWKCLRSPRASPPPPHSVSLYLFHPFFHSHWHSSLGAPFWCPVSIGDSSGDASVGAHTSTHASSPCRRKFKLELRCTHTQLGTQTDTVTHSGGLWGNARSGA